MSDREWLRRLGEPERAYACFTDYLNQAAPRSLSAIAILGRAISESEARGLFRLWQWGARVTAFDNYMQSVRDAERAEVARYTAHDRQVANEQLLAMALSTLRGEAHKLFAVCRATESPGMIKPEVVLKLIPEYIKLSRLLGGETTSNEGGADPFKGLSLEQLKRIEEIIKEPNGSSSD